MYNLTAKEIREYFDFSLRQFEEARAEYNQDMTDWGFSCIHERSLLEFAKDSFAVEILAKACEMGIFVCLAKHQSSFLNISSWSEYLISFPKLKGKEFDQVLLNSADADVWKVLKPYLTEEQNQMSTEERYVSKTIDTSEQFPNGFVCTLSDIQHALANTLQFPLIIEKNIMNGEPVPFSPESYMTVLDSLVYEIYENLDARIETALDIYHVTTSLGRLGRSAGEHLVQSLTKVGGEK